MQEDQYTDLAKVAEHMQHIHIILETLQREMHMIWRSIAPPHHHREDECEPPSGS